jgi:hypothetical protein
LAYLFIYGNCPKKAETIVAIIFRPFPLFLFSVQTTVGVPLNNGTVFRSSPKRFPPLAHCIGLLFGQFLRYQIKTTNGQAENRLE